MSLEPRAPITEPRAPSPEQGTVLLGVFLVISVVSVYLAAYVFWQISDQRNLIRQQDAEEAGKLALAGLERAKADLFLDNNWLDGGINGNPVIPPDPNAPDTLYFLYNNVLLQDGNYSVEIDYLQIPPACSPPCLFDSKRIRVRSTGTIISSWVGPAGASRTVEEIVSWSVVRNQGPTSPPPIGGKLYTRLQSAIAESASGDELRITQTQIRENLNLNGKTYNLTGCYDSNFTFRNCMDYPSRISGSVTISGGAATVVTLSGMTIE